MFQKLMSFLFILGLISCAPKPETIGKSKVTVRMPASINQSELRHYKPAGAESAAIRTLDDIDCYAIVVSWYDQGNDDPEPLPPPGACIGIESPTNTNGAEVVLHGARAVFGSIPDGDVLEVEVASGPARNFQILGFSYAGNSTDTNNVDGAIGAQQCPNFHNLTVEDRAAMSDAVLVGSAKTDLSGGEIELPITISMTGSQAIDKCEGGPFNWGVSHEALWDTAKWDEGVWGN